MKPILTLSLFIVIAFNTAIGQVKTNFNNPESISAKGKFNKDFRAKNAYVIPARDIKALVDKEALDNASGEARPFMIAEAVSVDIDVTREAVWFEDNEFAYCFDADSNVGQWKFTFQAWSPTCNPSQNANGTTFNGSTLRSRSAGSDFCLVELNQVPTGNSGITYSGWSRNTVGIQNTTIIHHPAGDVMKISRDDQPPVFATFLGSQEWQLVLDQGATNGGSSGAPYYDQNHRIIAQHHGINQNNADQCLNTNKFGGRFNVSWDGDGTDATRLRNWLDPSNSGAMTIDSRAIPFATGPTLVCTTGTFTLQNQPIGSTVTWSSASPTTLTIDSNSGVATRQNGANGIVIITASVTMPGCPAVSVSPKTVWVGVPNQIADILKGSGAIAIGATVPFSIHDPNNMSTGSVTYDWDVSGGYFAWIDTYAWTTITEPYLVLYAGSRNVCGSLGMISRSWSAENGGCPPGEICEMSVFPNPSSDELTVSLSSTDNKNTTTNVKLADSNGTVVYSGTAAKNAKEIKIPVKDLKNGAYYLSITQGRTIKQQQIIIRH